MNIESCKYITDPLTNETNTILIVVDGIEMSVPLDPNNGHYAEILRQVEAGTLVIQEAN